MGVVNSPSWICLRNLLRWPCEGSTHFEKNLDLDIDETYYPEFLF